MRHLTRGAFTSRHRRRAQERHRRNVDIKFEIVCYVGTWETINITQIQNAIIVESRGGSDLLAHQLVRLKFTDGDDITAVVSTVRALRLWQDFDFNSF